MIKKIKLLATLMLISGPACANTGFPMIFNTLPLMLLALIPLILFEAAIVNKICKSGYKLALITMAVANLITTFVGLPLSNILGYIVAKAAYAAGYHWYNGSGSIANTIFKATFGFVWFDPSKWIKDESGQIIMPLPNEPGWYFLLSVLFALFVNYMVSWYFEYLYMKKKLPSNSRIVRHAAIMANLSSYAIIVVFLIVGYYVIA